MAKMISPVKGKVSSEYGYRWGVLHAGIDIAAPLGTPVYASFAGVVEIAVSNRVHDRTSAQTRNRGKAQVAPYRTGNGARVRNPDGEVQLYGHVRPVVKTGQNVRAGQLIGVIDLSGNTTGPHLHFETWNTRRYTYNPRLAFNNHKITVGSSPVIPKTSKPQSSSGGSAKGTSYAKRVYVRGEVRNIQTALKAMGYYAGLLDDHYGKMTFDAVKAYQANQRKYAKALIAADGDWGPKTQKWYEWVKTAQNALNGWKGSKLRVDGDYSKVTYNRVREWQTRNGLFLSGVLSQAMTRFMRKHGTRIQDRPDG